MLGDAWLRSGKATCQLASHNAGLYVLDLLRLTLNACVNIK